ncbi:DNA/RNA polymerase, partial [Ramicandelaber brevisporus]
MISAVDIASFFTTIRIEAGQRKYWVVILPDGKTLQSTRLVQGNCSSPAIAVHFLDWVVRTFAPKLVSSGRYLSYVDNVWIKSIPGDTVDDHLTSVLELFGAFHQANLLVNRKKSVIGGVHEIDILGHLWSSDRSIRLPDRRVQTIRDLDVPTTLKQQLYIPSPSDRLVIRVDASNSGVGSVCLVQNNPDDDGDVRVAGFYSHAFEGQEGQQPAPYLEAYGAVKAAEHFAHIVGSRANKRIETDASTVVGIYGTERDASKTKLAEFAAKLSALGYQQWDIVHR